MKRPNVAYGSFGLILGAVIVFAGCGQSPNVVDGGVADAGLLRDAGSGTVSMTIAANPNSVLSAIATVSWTGPVASIQVTYSAESESFGETPATNVAALSSPQQLPVLGLRDSTTYSFEAVSIETAGAVATSNPVTLTTGMMPLGVPRFDVTTSSGQTPTPGYTLVAAEPLTVFTPYYVTIIDNTGYPAWYFAATPTLGGDFQQQPDGSYTISLYDSSITIPGAQDTLGLYNQIDGLGNVIHVWSAASVPTATPPITVLATDDHDIRLQPNGDALFFGVDELNNQDLTSYGGQTGSSIIGDVLERVTVSGDVTFAWDALQHMDIANLDPACTSINTPYVDFPHTNAVDVTSDGNYLVSLRTVSQVVKIDSTTGDILWKLGGKDGQFTVMGDPLGSFSCQHGARELPNGDIILFDDGDGHNPPQSRAAEYALDMTAMTATLVWSAEASPMQYAYVMGYAQRLSTGNTLITYGTAHDIEEVDQGGNLVWRLTDPNVETGIYRAYRVASLYGP